MNRPFTYLIRFIPTGQQYYGVRTAKNCHPDQLWDTYFTSSKVVKSLIAEYDKSAFEVISILEHATADLAKEFEEFVLCEVSAATNTAWLNRHNGGTNFSTTGISPTQETRDKTRNSMIGKHAGEKNPMFNKPISDAHRAKLIKAAGRGAANQHFGRKRSQETRQKISIAKSGLTQTAEANEKRRAALAGDKCYLFGMVGEKNMNAKKYIVTFPSGEVEIVVGLNNFCKQHGLTNTLMCRVANGIQRHHKQYKCVHFDTSGEK
jgi:hypothetical protein